MVVLLTASILPAFAAEPVRIDNDAIAVTFDRTTDAFVIEAKGRPQPVLTGGKFERAGSGATVVPVTDKTFGEGKGIEVTTADGGRNLIEVYPHLPFALFRAEIPNAGSEDSVLQNAPLLKGAVASSLAVNVLGTGGLTPASKKAGSYAFLAFADPKTHNGLVCGWLTHERGDGVVFSNPENGTASLAARIDYGCLRIHPKARAQTETFMIGCFDDARAGLEAYADSIACYYKIKLHPMQPGHCTWYMDKHAGACDEAHLKELAVFATQILLPYGFGFLQIDDQWQAGASHNGPNKNFSAHRPDGPYPSGMKATAETIDSLGMTPGIWFMPFAGNWDDPWFKDHQDWFVKRKADGKPYDTAWGGTCLDMSNPDTRKYVSGVVSRIAHEWGYRLFKMDGFWTGSATKQIYVNEGYKDDGIGDAVFHDPEVTNIEALRSGVKLVRAAAGPDVFFLGCCVAQNMRSFGGSFGLLDGMRVGPDTGAGTIGYPWSTRFWFLNGRVWWNDPDCVSVRETTALGQARINASFAAISGGVFYDSDWMPDLPCERIDILRRCMPLHGLPARPVDILEREPASVWHLPDTRSAVRRDIVALFNYSDRSTVIGADASAIGLPKADRYIAFDFWANKFIPPFTGAVSAELPAHTCRVLAVKPVADVPQLLSTSRHVTQGIVDVTGERWDAASSTLSAASRAVGGDPYELRIVLPEGERSWIAKAVFVSAGDQAASVTTVFRQNGPRLRVTLSSPVEREVKWSVKFEPGAVQAGAPKAVADLQAKVAYSKIALTWKDDDGADSYRVTLGDGKVIETPEPRFEDTAFRRDGKIAYRVQAVGWKAISEPVAVEAVSMPKLTPPPAPPLPSVQASDLQVRFLKNGHGPGQLDKACSGKPLHVGGAQYDKGIGMAAPAEAACPIPAGARRFVAVVGVNDSARAHQQPLAFKVFGDVKEMGEQPVLLAESPEISPATVQDWTFNLELNSRFKELRFVAEQSAKGKNGALVDWVKIGFVMEK